MSKRTILCFFLLFLLIIGFSVIQVLAENKQNQQIVKYKTNRPEPRTPEGYSSGSSRMSSDRADTILHNKMVNARSDRSGINALSATGGPDDFGYTWDDSIAYSWELTTINSSITGDENVGLVSIGFPFKFYEQVWDEVYVTTNGILIFGNPDSGCCGGFEFPSPRPPNNVIAPFSEDLAVGDNHNDGGIYLENGGSAPDRFFVVEWRDVTVWWDDFGDPYTFQVILHENGDIVFQYQTISATWWWYTIGIEDSYGLDGLAYPDWVENGEAIRFYRPEPSVRVAVNPPYQGTFTKPGKVLEYEFQIRNTGELGADVFNFLNFSGWLITLYSEDGNTPLTDTNSDSMIDTGPVAQGSSVTVVAKVNTPSSATIGDHNVSEVTAVSALNPAENKRVTLQAAVPTRFAQSYQDDADFLNNLYLAHPGGGRLLNAGSFGEGLAIAEGPTNYVYVWNHYSYLNPPGVSVSELFYGIIDEVGISVQQLTSHLTATINTQDYNPAVAVAPDGKIGVIWKRELWDNSTYDYKYDIYFAVLDTGGTALHGPENITNIDTWNTYGITDPRITATDDNRFVLAWQIYYDDADIYYNDIHYAIYDSNGSLVKSPTNHTNDPGDTNGEANYNPSVARLANNRFLLVHQHCNNTDGSNLYYTVLDSAGNTVSATTNLTNDSKETWDWVSDAVEFSDGRIIVAWMEDYNFKIHYAILDASYNIIFGPSEIGKPLNSGDGWMSVTADANGHAVITWQDYFYDYRPFLYYSLVDSDGNIITPTTIFQTSQAEEPYIFTNFEGYGNTTYLNDHNFPWLLDKHIFIPMVIR